MNKNIISITHSAASHIKDLIMSNPKKPLGISINLQIAGCSGNKYKFDYVYKKRPSDEEVIDKGVNIFIDMNTALKIFGTQLDYVSSDIKSGFVFNNPNERGKCGCGESVYL